MPPPQFARCRRGRVSYRAAPEIRALSRCVRQRVRAAKGSTPALSTFDGHAGRLTEIVLLGRLAVRLGRTIEVNPATELVTSPKVPEEWVRPVYRRGWSP